VRVLLRYTKYEKARIIGARALQIAMGAPVLIDTPEGMADPIEIALLEFEKKAIPLTVLREKRQKVSFPRVT
jgi:DNA-directed RNA polymerase subunit K